MPGYRRTHSCTGEEDTDLRLEDGKCGYSACDCALVKLSGSAESVDSNSHTNHVIQFNASIIGTVLVDYVGYSGCRNDEGGYDSYQRITSIRSSGSWITNLRTSQEGVAGVKVTCNISENTTYESRTSTISLTNACGESSSFSISQDGKDCTLTNDSAVLNIDSDAYTKRVTVTSTTGQFDVSEDLDWISISNKSSSSFTINISENTGTEARSGIVNISNSCGDRSLILIAQAGRTINCISGTVTLHYNPTHGNYSGYSMNLRSERNLDRQLNGAFVYRLNNTGAIYTIYYTSLLPNRSSWTETRFGGTSETVPHNGEKVYFVLYEGGYGNTPYPDSTVEEDCGGIVVQMDND